MTNDRSGSGDNAAEDGTIVPHEALSATALHRVIEEFVTRAGTDYGAIEASLERKIADVKRQLEHGEAQIVFDTATGTTSIVSTR